MGLEATMILVDNSENSRNGDYLPSRYEAQSDAVGLIFSAKTNANAESSVGLMSMAGNGPTVLTTLTADMGKILDGLHRTKIEGYSDFTLSLNIAALALKHRQNKVQRQRIVVFCCSPIPDDEKTLSRLAKKMKKNNISVDIIVFGEPDAQTMHKLRQFSETVQSTDGCFFDLIPAGPHLLSDALLGTSLLANEGVGGVGQGGPAINDSEMEAGGAGNRFEFGVNPEDDPELALALRLSYEEHKAGEAAAAKLKEAAEKEMLEGIPEEGDERIPLLSEEVEGGSASKDAEESEQKKTEDKSKDNDAMDAS